VYRAGERRIDAARKNDMKVLIVHAHPEPQSFNAALTQAATTALREAGHDVTVSDLYAEHFDPVAGRHDFLQAANPDRFHYQSEQAHAAVNRSFAPDLAREQARLQSADLLVLQFPLWWGSPPAILKGWLERVLAYGIAYVDGRRFTSGLFKGRRAIISVTTGGTPERFRPEDVYGNIEQVLWPVRRLALEYMGYDVEEPFVSYAAPRVTDAERAVYLRTWCERVVATAAKPVTSVPLDSEALIASTGPAAWSRA
jgi:NAD(P)H dehydrogenase (quinone)